MGQRGVAPNLFIYVVYVAPIGSKQEKKSLFQNLVVNIIEVQTLGGIVLLVGDFNAHTITLLNTVDTNDLCELLQAPEPTEIEQLSALAKRQNRDASVGG
jgi:ATP-dependent protease Clp ATPase subunit